MLFAVVGVVVGADCWCSLLVVVRPCVLFAMCRRSLFVVVRWCCDVVVFFCSSYVYASSSCVLFDVVVDCWLFVVAGVLLVFVAVVGIVVCC